MVAKIKLVISETNKTIDTVVMETSTTPASLMKSLEEFKIAANASLTKLIENSGYSGMYGKVYPYTDSAKNTLYV